MSERARRPPRQPSASGPARILRRLPLAAIALCALVLSPVTAPAFAAESTADATADAAPPRLFSTAAAGAGGTARTRAPSASQTTAPAPTAAAVASYSGGLRSQKVRLADVRDDGPTAQQRLDRIDVTRDLTKKTLTAKVAFAAAPTASLGSTVFVFLGLWSGSTCKARVAIAAEAAASGVDGAFFASSGEVDGSFSASRSRDGKALTITSAAHDRIRSAKLDCAYAFNQSTDAATLYTSFYAEDLQNTYVPKLKIETRESLQGNYKGKTTKVRVQVSNIGESDAKKVKVSASGTGLKVSKPTQTVATLEDGRSKTLTFSVKIKSGTQRTLKVTAVASGGKKVTTKVTIVEKPKPKKYSSLSGRYFWGYMPTTLSDYRGWETRAVWFLDAKWAYTDVPKNGKKPKCTTSTSACKRYTYNAKTGVAKIGSQKFTVNTEGFTYKAKKKDAKKSIFEPITLPKKGAKYSFTLERDDWTGYCLITCTATSERLHLSKNGKFVWQRSSVGSWTGIGSSWAIVPPDQRGTYKVIGTGRIEFRFSDGKKKQYTFGIMKDIRGKTATRAGIVVGAKNFY